ncbi:alpha-L-fucosidase [Lacibacter cauensis]|uniref:alpha-L-fucosidase n=1 Tax=Lacibacter cauensis TaxID=510947 RepID=A0A562SWE3_9BACT|nr:alpha-L-fucosidase [Lacibacter cauensis]TWI85605.1 alpha-L-fucosidase [Lacibacter cauensis]
MKRFAVSCIIFAVSFIHASAQTADSVRTSFTQPVVPRVTLQLPGGKAKDIPKGPYKPSWQSIKDNYKVPDWFLNGKFGIFIHYGVYTVAAHASEWYPRHMYSNDGVRKWHEAKFGPVHQFGYKDLIPLFKMEQFKAEEWAALFKAAGARYVIPTAEHHDGFAMYESALTKWDAKDMGPRIDFIGELGKAVRKEGLKFGVSNHRMEHWDFMYPQLKIKTDLFDPAYSDFYGPPQVPPQRTEKKPGEEVIEDQQKAYQSVPFLEEWLMRCQELVDKYQPDMFWFDNGVNSRMLDSVKLRFAAYYYNRAAQWKKPVSISTKSDAYLEGSIKDFERQGRAPKELTNYVWQVDDPIGEKFGYVEGMKLTNAATIIRRLIENVARNGNYMLNISPRADGTIPQEQKDILLGVGKWLQQNGEGIYDTRAWHFAGAGQVRFTRKGNTLYALLLQWPSSTINIEWPQPEKWGAVKKVTLLGAAEKINFTQTEKGITIQQPQTKPGEHAWVFKLEGLTLD